MKVNRAFKSFFLSPKNNKTSERFYIQFSSTLNISVQRSLYPLFQNQSSHFMLPLLSKEYLKMMKQNTVDYHPSPSGLTSRIHPLIFLWAPSGFISPDLQNICWNFSGSCISHHGRRKFSNLWCQAYWKMHLYVKKMSLFIFTHAPKQNSLPGSYRHHSPSPTRDKEITHFSQSEFFENPPESWKNDQN